MGGGNTVGLDSPKLSKVLEDVAAGVMQLPDFQRDWKWDDQRIRELIATVTLDYPLGVVMTLETGGRSPFRARTLTGADQTTTAVTPNLLLLDGQQRLTSLFQALHLDRPVLTTDARNKPVKRWYYVDIAKAVGSPADRDEAIVSVPEDKVLRSDFARKVQLDLSSTERECQAAHFPLHRVFDVDRISEWQRAFVRLDDANWGLWSRFQEQVLKNVQSFQIPMIKLDANTTNDAVCSVFERVNTGGVPLDVFELLTATYAGDRGYERKYGDYYRLPEVWQGIKRALSASHPVFGPAENGGSDGLTSSDFLQAVALVLTWERKQQGRAAAVSCKRRDLLELPLADFIRLAPRVTSAFMWVGKFLERQCIVRADDLPYRTQLVPLAAVRTVLEDGIEDDSVRMDQITRWYWCGVLGEMYSGSTESRFTRDVEQLLAWTADDPHVLPDTIAEAVFVAYRLDTLTTRNSAAYKGIYALLVKQGAVDWYYNEEPLNPSLLLQYSVGVRQIFPKGWFTRNRPADKRANSIVNKTPLSYRASRNMTGSPASYLKSLAAESGIRPEWFDDAVATHLVDPVTLREGDFDGFYADRSKQLLELVNAAMGKRTVFRDRSDR
ncbi:GmrSD restriction endonuclease domain-containing protein [Streptomyces sp.]|uniref:GmrSD restriction endonuclease domain-containing protein n=1 Tax=Streptomyces sp. TaxID=1931 RepID=UPI002F3EF116